LFSACTWCLRLWFGDLAFGLWSSAWFLAFGLWSLVFGLDFGFGFGFF